ncbi:FxLYD domain-containing protein [Deinococcus depolymerans]|uniref:Membrane protein 6-pyruvoyl-tetrahydropterin synthase-related domain-containing protein n=1 Tax=Deinococcus depolymerans TaxID=392408 RepID=A0ABN1BQX5_9DEIO
MTRARPDAPPRPRTAGPPDPARPPSLAIPGATLNAADDERAGGRLLAFALLIVIVLHGAQLISGSFTRTYDALIHVYFGAHYARSFFDPWESGWYTGFSLTSYPPLSHYLIALLSLVFGLMGAFALTQLLALVGLTVGMYRFGKVFVTARAAGYGAVLLTLSSAIAETVHVFGQLPTTLSLGLLLNAIPYAARYVQTGQRPLLLRAAAFTAATTAAHHVTTLFGSVFFIAPVLLAVVLQGASRPRPGEAQGGGWQHLRRRVYRALPRVYRGALYGALAVTALVTVVLPYWLWSRSDPITQVPIPHGSRANFLVRTDFGFMFWLVPWATLLPLYWDAARRGLGSHRGLPRWPVLASVLLLTLLGTGGTTPLPKLLLRGAFDILTLDRFTFWAVMLLTPLAGLVVESWRHGAWRVFVQARLGRRVHHLLGLGLVTAAVTLSCLISALTYYRRFQPAFIDVAPIVRFLESGGRDRYRYLVLGFGDQMAWLSANTRATTPDGNYHSARRLPELTATPVERLEGAKYTGVPGLGSLTQFLTTPARYNLRFVLSNDAFYDPALHALGWSRLGTLPGGIVVWEQPGIPALQPRLPRRELPVWQRLMWALLPSAAAAAALLSLLVPLGAAPGAPRRSRWPWVRLLAEDSREPPPSAGHWWDSWVRRLPFRPWRTARLRAPRLSPARRLVNSALLLAALLGGAALLGAHLRPAPTPERTLLAYWDAIDFKRFGDAYRLIDPQDGLTEERWRLDLSVVGGLRSGYAKLDRLKVGPVTYSAPPGARTRVGTLATAQLTLTWFTAFGNIRETLWQELRLTEAGWRLSAQPQLTVRPPRRFRPLPTLTRAAPVGDTPVPLRVLNARLVAFRSTPGAAEQVAVVGEAVNAGREPAAVDVTATVLDAGGTELARNTAGTHALHWLLPGERTPFRVTFGGPGMTVRAAQVGSFAVRAQGWVTARGLDRSLNVWSQGDAVRVENAGAGEATITNVLRALTDPGGVAWVTQTFLLEAVPPDQSRTALLGRSLPAGYRVLLPATRRAAPPVSGSVVYADAFRREEP